MNAKNSPDGSNKSSRRQFGRVRVAGLKSPIGHVVDISAGGMCIQGTGGRWKPGPVTDVVIKFAGRKYTFPVKITWVRYTNGFLRSHFAMGVQFHNLAPEQKQIIAELARTGMQNSVIVNVA
jgi:hypothetical protein